MRMTRRMLSLVAAALLLMGMLPVGALAAGTMPEQITSSVLAEVYSSDADCQITMQTWDALYRYASWKEMEGYSYQWKILSGLDQTQFYKYEEDPMSADYFCTKSEASPLKGKGIAQCEVYDGQKKLTTITFEVEEVIYAPVAKDVPSPQYVYYTPGQPVTASLPAPSIGGNAKVEYSWTGGNMDSFEDYPDVNAPSITLTLGADQDGWGVTCQASTYGYTNYKEMGYFIFLNREKNPIGIPALSGGNQEYYLAAGKSETLTLPTATSGDPNKTVEYRWYMIDWDVDYNEKFCETTSTPQLTVTNTPDKYGKWLYYICKAGYKGEPESSFLEYGMHFNVSYLTPDSSIVPSQPTSPAKPTSVPKTGDNTPLTALFLLLGISLAGTTLLASRRRKHS